jgi:hypothetical protein
LTYSQFSLCISDINFCTGVRFVARHADALVMFNMAARNAWSGAAKRKGGQVMRLDASALAILIAIAVSGL